LRQLIKLTIQANFYINIEVLKVNYLQGIFCYLPMVILTNKPTIYKRLNIKKWGRFHDDLGTK